MQFQRKRLNFTTLYQHHPILAVPGFDLIQHLLNDTLYLHVLV